MVIFNMGFFFFFFNYLGWQGNVEQRTPGAMAASAPVSQGGMNR
jgi:hypothetical protein